MVYNTFKMYSVCFVVFFFKQKTAYEMRISDWSSDVCSSDLDSGKFDRLATFSRLDNSSHRCSKLRCCRREMPSIGKGLFWARPSQPLHDRTQVNTGREEILVAANAKRMG